MHRKVMLLVVLIFVSGCFVSGCFTPESEKTIVLQQPESKLQLDDLDLITVQHVLVNFETTLPGSFIARDKTQAKELAEELKKRADGGEDFQGLVDEFSGDKEGKSTFIMADSNIDRQLLPASVSARKSMVKNFGDVAFSLDVGEVGIAEYDEQDSPYGFHVIKRIK